MVHIGSLFFAGTRTCIPMLLQAGTATAEYRIRFGVL
jgi:hypothetical protein